MIWSVLPDPDRSVGGLQGLVHGGEQVGVNGILVGRILQPGGRSHLIRNGSLDRKRYEIVTARPRHAPVRSSTRLAW